MNCLQHEGNLPKVPLHPIVSTTPMGLMHIDFTSIKMTMELNRLPKVANVLVIQGHFTKHVIVYVTPNQTTRTITKFLYQGYISIFGALATLLSDCSVNIMSSIIGEMCILLSMKLQTMPYHPQTKWVGREVSSLIKLSSRLLESWRSKKSDWLSHLAEIVHTYNAAHSTVTGYSHTIWCLGTGQGFQSTFISPP